ncbi:hypothetical protein E4T56_gene16750 [Termitomyces sp. T112]|nr:hypothetical protein C0989_007989 [Termitomyces sp. Mn162]KAG5732643.1 hypothetical protein E4T56_gene16750 [Termitomyces sp. T112]KAH0591551.1 hypothetical protein H2248_001609 [Termitomyces sp. 'cryptogamus']
MAEPIRTDRVRILFLLKRKEGMTREQFSNYWRVTHAELFLSLSIVKTNILGYEQVHKDSLETGAMGFTVSDWDGVIVLDAESYDKIFEVFGSEEYQRVVKPDEANFLDREKCQLLPGGIVTVIA